MTASSQAPHRQHEQTVYEIEVRLMPQATCGLSLKIMSVLHARAVELRSFSFVRREGHASAASIRVSSSPARLATLVATLDQVVGVVEVIHSTVEVDEPCGCCSQ
jgi:hypothetical protein